MTNQTNKPTEPGIWTREGKFYRVWMTDLGLNFDVIFGDGTLSNGSSNIASLPTGNWHKLTAPATNAEAREKFRGWLKGHCNQSSDEQIADKAAEIFAGVEREAEATGFTECDTCRAKPGTPYLCSGCLKNRYLISELRKEVEVRAACRDQITTLKSTVAKLEEQVATEHAKYINSERAATVAIQAQTILKQAEEIAELKRDKRTLEFQLHEAQQERNAEQQSATRWRDAASQAVTLKGVYWKTLARLSSLLEVEIPSEPREIMLVGFVQAVQEKLAKQQPTVIEGKGQAVTGVYVASRASLPERPAMWRKLREKGWPINSTWIDEAGEGETKSMQELWARIAREIAAASAVVLYAEEGDLPLKGALIEVGMAIGMGKPVFACLPGVALDARSFRPVGSWLAHPLVTRLNSTELIANRLGIPTRPAFVAPPKPEIAYVRVKSLDAHRPQPFWGRKQNGNWYDIDLMDGSYCPVDKAELLDPTTGEPIKE